MKTMDMRMPPIAQSMPHLPLLMEGTSWISRHDGNLWNLRSRFRRPDCHSISILNFSLDLTGDRCGLFAIDWPIDESQYQGIHLSAFISGKVDDAFKEALVDVIAMGAQLDPDAAPMVNMAPSNQGNHSLGAQDGKGHHTNPFTGEPYLPQWVNHADYARVIAEYWADGPDSETPPGHWNVLANEVVDHPEFERKFMGKGEPLSPLEWDVRMYFLLNGAVHDAAVAAWGLKRQFDTSRPVSAIRHLGQLGQCTDPSLGSYHPLGLPLVEGLIMLVTDETVAADGMHAHLGASSIGQIAVKAWRARAMEMDPAAGVGWILAQNWMPYQQLPLSHLLLQVLSPATVLQSSCGRNIDPCDRE